MTGENNNIHSEYGLQQKRKQKLSRSSTYRNFSKILLKRRAIHYLCNKRGYNSQVLRNKISEGVPATMISWQGLEFPVHEF